MIRAALTLALFFQAATAIAGEVHVLAINGGGDKRDNFASHLSHLRQLVDYLGKAGIPKTRITVLSGDGADPKPDLAVREPDPEGTWLLEGTREGGLLRDLDEYQNSTLEGFVLRPATLPSITRTLGELKTRLHAGDTLLLYVTDHGTDSRRDPIDNQIVLWGTRRGLTARALGKLLRTLPTDVRVVSLMSQCFSGGFAYLGEARGNHRRPSHNTCGYFSSTPDRPAYGCYPEVRGQKAVGHSFEFLSALSPLGHFGQAHDTVLVEDDTPDVPLKTSDVYFSEMLAREAGDPKRETGLLDGLLSRARKDRQEGALFTLADTIAARFGFPAPATVGELDQRMETTLRLLDEWQANVKTWTAAIGDFNQATLRAFLDSHPTWAPQLKLPVLGKLDAGGRRQRLIALLNELVPFVERDTARVETARHLVTAIDSLDTIAYRAEIRLAALWRIRFLYTRVAGHRLTGEKPALAKTAQDMETCEDLRLPAGDPPRLAKPTSREANFPHPADDEKLAATFRPAWLGVTFLPVTPDRHKRLGLPLGAALITRVSPKSPAEKAGLRVGDIVAGVDGHPLERPGELRPLLATSKPGRPLGLDLRRNGAKVAAKAEPMAAPAPPPVR